MREYEDLIKNINNVKQEEINGRRWYLVNQETNFSKVSKAVEILEDWKKTDKKTGYKEYIKNNGVKSDPRIYSMARNYGLLNITTNENAESTITPVGEDLIKGLIDVSILQQQQLEKFVIDQGGSVLFPTYILYKIMVSLYENEKNLESAYLSKNEFWLFVSLIGKYSDIQKAVNLIIDSRKKGNQFKKSVDSIMGNSRINLLFSQLDGIESDRSRYLFLNIDMLEEIKRKIEKFEYCMDQYKKITSKEAFKILKSNVSLWDYFANKNSIGKNIIYLGAPGTGKSHDVKKLIKEKYPTYDDKDDEDMDSNFIFRTTIYSDYSYYDFIGDIRPVKKDGNLNYDFQPGIFTRALYTSYLYPNNAVFLIVEEMTRGDIASIFGDTFQLLDRDSKGISDYSITNDNIIKYFHSNKMLLSRNKIRIPSNLYLIGTLNSNDQNVNVVDTAFKRRFDFKVFTTSPKTQDNNFTFYVKKNNGKEIKVKWFDFYQLINKFIVEDLNLNEDKQIGQWFIKGTDDARYNTEQIRNKLLNYLWIDVEQSSFSNEKMFPNFDTFSQIYNAFENESIFNKKIFNLKD
jgi:hypothetical protein